MYSTLSYAEAAQSNSHIMHPSYDQPKTSNTETRSTSLPHATRMPLFSSIQYRHRRQNASLDAAMKLLKQNRRENIRACIGRSKGK